MQCQEFTFKDSDSFKSTHDDLYDGQPAWNQQQDVSISAIIEVVYH